MAVDSCKGALITYFERDGEDIKGVFRVLHQMVSENNYVELELQMNDMHDDWHFFWTHLSTKISSLAISMKSTSNDAYAEMCNYISRSSIDDFMIVTRCIKTQKMFDKLSNALMCCKNINHVSLRGVRSKVDVSRIFSEYYVNTQPKTIFLQSGRQSISAWENVIEYISTGIKYKLISFSSMSIPDDVFVNLCNAIRNGHVFNVSLSFSLKNKHIVAPAIEICKRGPFLHLINIGMRTENQETAEKMVCDVEPRIMDMRDRKGPLSICVGIYYPKPGATRGAMPDRISIRNKFRGVVAPSKI